MFLGRDRELAELNRLYAQERFQCFVLYGRRRVGKTTLLNAFCRDKDAIFFSAEVSNDKRNLDKFSQVVQAHYGEIDMAPFASWVNAWSHIVAQQQGRPLVLVLDEFPYLADKNPEVLSNMQHFIDDMNYFSELLQEYHRPKSLFIVDDDPDYLTVLHHWLSPSYRVTCFTGASQLLDGLNVSLPDLILMDYEMPEMDGYELMTTLRNQRATKKIPIIFLTGKNDRDLVYRILEHKPDGYLLKTSQKDSLLEAIGGFFRETVFRESL